MEEFVVVVVAAVVVVFVVVVAVAVVAVLVVAEPNSADELKPLLHPVSVRGATTSGAK